ncbi:MAG: hypothetical protein IPO22_16645 [Anaerolineales bacterium]|nr:hypothetical protein [Anaerolineales bacterium]
MAGITRFEDIEAWKTARQLTNAVYDHTNQQGFSRDFGLPVNSPAVFLP